MPRDRFFVEGTHVAGDRVQLAAADARKLITVLRRRTGDGVQVVDAAGTAFAARLDIAGKAVFAALEDAVATAASTEAGLRVVVAQAIPKGQKMDGIVEKASELGVAAIVPLRSARVEGERTGEHKRERWQRIAESAARQSGRSRVLTVEPEATWPLLIATFGRYDRVYVAWESAPAGPLRARFETDLPLASTVLIVVGPEGGFSAAEVAAAQVAGAIAISLGPRTLRTETAALVVVSALLYARGDI
jgi:16S rRNA (uracil1498-N3)-methyltransferase